MEGLYAGWIQRWILLLHRFCPSLVPGNLGVMLLHILGVTVNITVLYDALCARDLGMFSCYMLVALNRFLQVNKIIIAEQIIRVLHI